MPDIFTKKKRSELMSRIRSEWTKWERTFYGEHPDAVPHPDWLPFRPDFLLKGRPVFLDSSFWHGFMKKRQFDRLDGWWQDKIIKNICRDLSRNFFYSDLRIVVLKCQRSNRRRKGAYRLSGWRLGFG